MIRLSTAAAAVAPSQDDCTHLVSSRWPKSVGSAARTWLNEPKFGLSCVSLRYHALQGLLTADPTLADGFKRTRFLVLDEADRLLEPTFQVRICTQSRV